MVQQNSLPTYLCIEPDDEFYLYLEKNVKRMKKKIPDLEVYLFKELVGEKIDHVSLLKNKGTASIDCRNGYLRSKSLDQILYHFKNNKKIRLLKTDVDGFDFDVLESSLNTIRKFKPILFFECYYNSEYQKIKYLNIIKKLNLLGYSNWVIFDNFGELILKTKNVEIIFNLLEYIWRQNYRNAKRTIDYLDILSCCDNDQIIIDKVSLFYDY